MPGRISIVGFARGLVLALLIGAAGPLPGWGGDAESPKRSGPATPRFRADGERGFAFDTGVLRGRLHADGRSLGLTEVIHRGSGTRLDRSNGLLSHYRVFARDVRYGDGAWDWPSEARLSDDGAVTIRFADEGRPFGLTAVYRFDGPASLAVETQVKARAAMKGFEVFLASYFDSAFTNAAVRVKTASGDGWLAATPDRGEWQMYVRDAAARRLAEDGRWKLEPHPVAWTFPGDLSGARFTARRVAPAGGLSAIFTAPAEDCFAVAMPHQTEGHYSIYFSLFGRDFMAGESAVAQVQLQFLPAEPAPIP